MNVVCRFSWILLDQKVKFTRQAGSPLLWENTIFGFGIYDASSKPTCLGTVSQQQDTRVLLARPCGCILLLLFCSPAFSQWSLRKVMWHSKSWLKERMNEKSLTIHGDKSDCVLTRCSWEQAVNLFCELFYSFLFQMGCNHHPATRSKTSSTRLESPALPTGQITGRFHSQEHNIWVFSPSPGSILVLRQFFGLVHVLHPWVLTFINPWWSHSIGASDEIFWSEAGFFTTCRASFRGENLPSQIMDDL